MEFGIIRALDTVTGLHLDLQVGLLNGSLAHTDTTATLTWLTQLDDGDVYWLFDENPSRTQAQIEGGSTREISAAGSQTDIATTGLTDETDYWLHIFEKDALGTPGPLIHIPFTTDATGDVTAPTISSSSPTDNATDVAIDVNPTITFDENVAFGTGNITLRSNDGGWADVEAFNVATEVGTSPGQVNISGAVLTIYPTADLDNSIEYAIRIDATAIDDTSGNSFAGIANDTTLSFTTEAAAAPFTLLGSTFEGVMGSQTTVVNVTVPDSRIIVACAQGNASDANKLLTACDIEGTTGTKVAGATSALTNGVYHFSAEVAGGGTGDIKLTPNATFTKYGGAVLSMPDGYTLKANASSFTTLTMTGAEIGDIILFTFQYADAGGDLTLPAGGTLIDGSVKVFNADRRCGSFWLTCTSDDQVFTDVLSGKSSVQICATAWEPPA